MNLFVINRYTGEENKSAPAESDKLRRVLKNIEKRKKQRKQRKLKAAVINEVIKENNTETPIDGETNASTAGNEPIHEQPRQDFICMEIDGIDKLPAVPENDDKREKKVENIDGFTVLNSEKYNKKQIVKRVLPRWLRNPSLVSMNLQNLDKKVSKMSEFDKDLKNKLKAKGVKYLFPVQAEFIPWQINASKCTKCIIPQDVCLSAPTGSGKTLAFLLPIFECLKQKLLNRRTTWKTVRALLVLPTQSLALQTHNTFKSICRGTELDVGVVTGEHSFQDEQKQIITRNSVWGSTSRVDILVCTAGRLVNHLKSTEGFDLSHLEYLVIDEADRVLDNIQDNWLHHLNIHLRANDFSSQVLNLLSVKNKSVPQKLLFSATLSQDPEKLQKLMLFQPKLFTCVSEDANVTDAEPDRFVGKYTTPTELSEKYVTCTAEAKPLVLYKIITDMISETDTLPRILIFTVSADMAHRLKLVLETMSDQKIKVGEISSNRLSLEKRNTLLNSFVNGIIQVLVCTDSMARGIDLPNVNCVISYSAPSYLKTYIHRAGRTARAGTQGLSITILQPRQKDKFLTMLGHAGKQNLEAIDITEENVEPLIPLYEKSLENLKQHIKSETENSLTKMKRGKKTGVLQKHRKKKVHVSKE